ncbi:hypothetical protein [Streptomyces sp. H27-C3]|uniref:hypothetical protein n=1 Tax=Streptomyces sp. H27-C3 TaxID=3046305 RepID=UPI0024BBB7B5|nr:hypothetical protein [Streptomyces sp. H27-C3]MDJ0466456.1 hypothetical protein [Streptomyces sp. H27-C3]
MISQEAGPIGEFVLRDGLTSADAVILHREALHVLRPGITTAHLDAYSDDEWPTAVLQSHERALSLAREALKQGTRSRRDDPGMGIDIDVRDDAQFEVLVDLAPYTIDAECSQEGQSVFSASDSGTSLWITITPKQETELRARLDALGAPSTALIARHAPAHGGA